MKKIIAALIAITSFSAFSQEDYTVKMSMKIEGLPPEYAGFGEQETITKIKGEKTRFEMSSMMMNSTTVFDGKLQTSITEAMGNKTGYTATKEEMDAIEKNNKSEKPKIEYTQEKKTIAGYECTKATVTNIGKEGKEMKAIVWVTDKIKSDLSNKKRMGGRSSMDLGDLKGYPLEIQMNTNQNGMDMKIVISATEVSTSPIDDSEFVLNTEGYKMVSYKDFMQKMQGR